MDETLEGVQKNKKDCKQSYMILVHKKKTFLWKKITGLIGFNLG